MPVRRQRQHIHSEVFSQLDRTTPARTKNPKYTEWKNHVPWMTCVRPSLNCGGNIDKQGAGNEIKQSAVETTSDEEHLRLADICKVSSHITQHNEFQPTV